MKNTNVILKKLLAAFMSLILLPPVAFSSEAATFLRYRINENGEAVILNHAESADYLKGEIVIPETIEGCPVTTIEPRAFMDCIYVTNVTIPDTVKYIGAEAFADTKFYMNSENWVDGVLYIGRHLIAAKEDEVIGTVTIREDTLTIADRAFRNCERLTSIVVPDGVEVIGEEAFIGCRRLTDVTFPDTVTSLGASPLTVTAFESDESNWIDGFLYVGNYLVGVKKNISGERAVKDGTLMWSKNAFKNCTSLEGLIIPNSVKTLNSGFYNATALKSVVLSDALTSIDALDFSGCTSLAEIIIPDNVTKIGREAFYGCSGLRSIVLPEGLKEIGKKAFYGCASLENIELPESLEIMHDDFNGCTSLKSVSISKNVKDMATSFSGCTSLTEINVDPENTVYKSVDGVLFSKDGKVFYRYPSGRTDRQFSVPDGVVTVGDSAFADCSSITSVSFPHGVTSIGASVFYGCSSLENVTLPYGLNSIGNLSFAYLSSFTDIYYLGNAEQWQLIQISSSNSAIEKATVHFLSTIPFELFYDVSDDATATITGYRAELKAGVQIPLRNLEIPNNLDGYAVTGIGDCAFYGCTTLETITLPEGIESIGADAFSNTAYYANAENWTGGALYIDGYLIAVSEDTEGTFAVADGTVCIADSAFYGCDSLDEITLPEGIESIGAKNFYGCKTLAKITLPTSVKSIGEKAFYGCKALDKIAIPAGVKTIEQNTFNGCEALAEIVLPDELEFIGTAAFYGCKALDKITIPAGVKTIEQNTFRGCEALAEIALPDGLENIGAAAFYGCKALDKITVPAGVKKIEQNTFNGCEALAEITLPDGLESIGAASFHGCKTLDKIAVPAGVKKIEPNTFNGCEALAEIALPDGLENIGAVSFYGCKSLVKITLPAGVKYIDATAFDGASSLADFYYGGTKKQWGLISGGYVTDATVHYLGQQCGDANCDEYVDLEDALLLLQFCVDWDVDIYPESADVNGDGKVTLSDVTLLMKYIAGWSVTLGK